MAYEIEFAKRAIGNLRGLTARQRSLVLNRVREELALEPLVQTRNRKRLRTNPVAPWELRLGNLRVYYDVYGSVVTVEAVGVKIRERVQIDDEDVEL